jgi:hypothetical protein
MDKSMTSAGFVQWLAQESHNLAQATSSGGDPFPYLWITATDALDWLRQAPLNERENALQAVRQCLNTESVGETAISTDKHKANCFKTLLRWVIEPPPVL